MKTRTILALTVLTSLFPLAASAKEGRADRAGQAMPAAMETRIVRYTYSPDMIFRIASRPALHTHIELGEDEGLKENPIIGDSLQWRVSGGPRNIYVKPIREDIETSLTVVTTKRSYQFQLISSAAGQVFQKVSFDHPDREEQIRLLQEKTRSELEAEESRLQSQIVASHFRAEDLNFDFDIRGDAPFRPSAVFTDGKFTYLKPGSSQDLPAIFLVDEKGSPSLVNYRVSQNYIVVERHAKRLLLKLGKDEVRITEKEQKR